jgi:hypothetical protein
MRGRVTRAPATVTVTHGERLWRDSCRRAANPSVGAVVAPAGSGDRARRRCESPSTGSPGSPERFGRMMNPQLSAETRGRRAGAEWGWEPEQICDARYGRDAARHRIGTRHREPLMNAISTVAAALM